MYQDELFSPSLERWKTPSPDELPMNWDNFNTIGLDVETRDPDLKKTGPGVRRDGYLVGISMAMGGRSYYMPIRHDGGGNMDDAWVLDYVRAQTKAFTGTIVGANLQYDLDYLMQVGCTFDRVAWFRDVLLNEVLIDQERMSYSLQNVAQRHGFEGKDERALTDAAERHGYDPKAELWRLHAAYVGDYAAFDAELPLLIWEKQKAYFEANDLSNICDLESRCIMPLLKMQRRGVRIDEDRLDELERIFARREFAVYDRIRNFTGERASDMFEEKVQVNAKSLWSSEALAPIIEAAGFTLNETPTGKKEITRFVLAGLGELGEAILEAREMHKLRHTFVESVRRHLTNGRLHCTFNQMAREADDVKGGVKGVRFGRLSASNPNVQQQPARGELAKDWRTIYLPEVDSLWACCDYSQQEPRWTTFYAVASAQRKAQAAAEAYISNPKLDNHDFMAELTGLDRKPAKAIFLGLCYGQGGAKLCDQLGLPTTIKPRYNGSGTYEAAGREGQKILDRFNEFAPYVRGLSKATQKVAEDRGWVQTAAGRKLTFGDARFSYKALNRLIQGSAADQAKAAMIELDRAGLHVMLQVHDEFDIAVSGEAQAKQAAEIMSEAHREFPLVKRLKEAGHIAADIPFRVDVEIGPNWGEIK